MRDSHSDGLRRLLDAWPDEKEACCREKKEFNPLADPRPDLSEDATLWKIVLAEAYSTDRNLHAVLNGFRCLGCRLVETPKGINLEPGFDRDCDWQSEADWQRARERWLVPRTRSIIELFDRAHKTLE